jgi:hypothetical protein
MLSPYYTRIDALLAAHTAHVGGHIIVIDLDALTHGINNLMEEAVHEAVVNALRERTDEPT